MQLARWAILIFSAAIMTCSCFADRARGAVLFMTIGPGARAAGMGEAFVALADDPTATFWNPAGLGRYPLSSRWYDFAFPDTEAQFFATIKSARADIDFRKYDFWAAGPKSLWLLRRDKWRSVEEYTVSDPEGESIRSILREFSDLRNYDSTYAYNVLPRKILDFNGLTDTIVPHDKKLEIPFIYFVPDSITCLASGEKVLWVGTTAGVYRYAQGVWRKERENGAPDRRITCMAVDDKDNLWVGTGAGLFVRKGSQWTSFTSQSGLPSSRVTAIYTRSHRDVWVGTQRGPAHFNGATWKTEYTYTVGEGKSWEQVIYDICGAEGTQRKEILAATLQTHNSAVDIPTVPSEIKVPYSLLFQGDITAIHVDRLENVWFGSALGIVRFDGKNWKNFGWRAKKFDKPTKLSDWIMEQWPDLSENGRLELTDKIRAYGLINNPNFVAGEVVEYPASPASGNVIDMGESFVSRDLMFATEYGLLRYYANMQQFRYVMSGGFNDEMVKWFDVRDGEFWFSTEKALHIYSQGKPGLSLMHVQWLPELASDIYYEYLSGVYYLEDWGTLGGAITYIFLGRSEHTNEAGEVLGGFYSYEMAMTLSYGARVMPNLYAGLNVKFIYSALAPQIYVGHEKKSGTGNSFAVDAGLLYDGPIKGMSFGACVQHLGPDIHYIDAAQADPLPRNLKVGMAYQILNTDYQKLTVAADIDKEIIKFKQEQNPWALEWRYAVKHIGLEYSYSNFFSLRGGYIIDYDYYPRSSAIDKINQENYSYDPDDYVATNYFTFGLGIHYSLPFTIFKSFRFDFAYIPRVSDPENQNQNLPLSDIKRFSLTGEF